MMNDSPFSEQSLMEFAFMYSVDMIPSIRNLFLVEICVPMVTDSERKQQQRAEKKSEFKIE